jgi:hypothetical protein
MYTGLVLYGVVGCGLNLIASSCESQVGMLARLVGCWSSLGFAYFAGRELHGLCTFCPSAKKIHIALTIILGTIYTGLVLYGVIGFILNVIASSCESQEGIHARLIGCWSSLGFAYFAGRELYSLRTPHRSAKEVHRSLHGVQV